MRRSDPTGQQGVPSCCHRLESACCFRYALLSACALTWLLLLAAAPADAEGQVPEEPRRLVAEADGETVMLLLWDPPSDSGGSQITGYKIEVSNNPTTGWSDLVANTASAELEYETHRACGWEHKVLPGVGDQQCGRGSSVGHRRRDHGRSHGHGTRTTDQSHGCSRRAYRHRSVVDGAKQRREQ